MHKINKSEKLIGIYLISLIFLISFALLLNNLVVENKNINEYIQEQEIYQKGSYEIMNNSGDLFIDYTWIFKNKHWNIKFLVDIDGYNAFKNITRTKSNDDSFYLTKTIEGNYNAIKEIYLELSSIAKNRNFNELETAQFISSFVESLPYEKDIDEYSKFPYETLYELKGDCEDLSILLAKLLSLSGLKTVFIVFDGHQGLGIKTEFESNFKINGSNYAYIETTSQGFKIGEIPEPLINKSYEIYETTPNNYIEIKPILKLSNNAENKTEYKMELEIENLGLKKSNFDIKILMISSNNETNIKKINNITLNTKENKKINNIRFPFSEEGNKFKIFIIKNNITKEKIITNWI